MEMPNKRMQKRLWKTGKERIPKRLMRNVGLQKRKKFGRH